MRRRALLALAWLPCVTCGALWPVSYLWGAVIAVGGTTLHVRHGAAVVHRIHAGESYEFTV